MSHCWLLLTFSWLGSVSLQYISPAGTEMDSLVDPQNDPLNIGLPQAFATFYKNDYQEPNQNNGENKRSIPESKKKWYPNLVDKDQTSYIPNEGALPHAYSNFPPGSLAIPNPSTTPKIDSKPTILESKDKMSYTVNLQKLLEDSKDKPRLNLINYIEEKEKKSFSPWGGKRDGPHIVENAWTWNRALNLREQSMPKRVRFSPWGGKRSGQMIYKPSTKGSKIIFSTSVPELTRVFSNMSPSGDRLFFIPLLDKRHPIKILSLTARLDPASLKEALPYKDFLEFLPKQYKPGHPYTDIKLNSEGKRKVKFSIWGGKRSPPIIGPIWTPASQDIKDATLNTILLYRADGFHDKMTNML